MVWNCWRCQLRLVKHKTEVDVVSLRDASLEFTMGIPELTNIEWIFNSADTAHMMFWNFRFGAVSSLAPVLFLAAYFNPKRMDIKTMQFLFSTLRLWCVLGAQLNPRPVCFKCLNPIYISANLCSTPALSSFAIHGFPPHLAFLQPQELVLNPGHRHCRQPDPGRSTLQIQYIKWPAVVVGRFNTAFLWLC